MHRSAVHPFERPPKGIQIFSTINTSYRMWSVFRRRGDGNQEKLPTVLHLSDLMNNTNTGNGGRFCGAPPAGKRNGQQEHSLWPSQGRETVFSVWGRGQRVFPPVRYFTHGWAFLPQAVPRYFAAPGKRTSRAVAVRPLFTGLHRSHRQSALLKGVRYGHISFHIGPSFRAEESDGRRIASFRPQQSDRCMVSR